MITIERKNYIYEQLNKLEDKVKTLSTEGVEEGLQKIQFWVAYENYLHAILTQLFNGQLGKDEEEVFDTLELADMYVDIKQTLPQQKQKLLEYINTVSIRLK